jgi:tetratricopeptide (TPR) repeat protein
VQSLAQDPESTLTRRELALLHRRAGRLEEAQLLLEAEQGRFVEKDEQLACLHDLLLLEQSEQQVAGYLQRASLLVKLRLWDEALPSVIQLFQSDAPPPDLYHLLYQCYMETGQLQRALAAAYLNQEHNPGGPGIAPADLDYLRWQLRNDSFSPFLSGKFGILVDSGHMEQALQLLRAENLYPRPGQDLDEEQPKHIWELPETMQEDLLVLLEKIGDAHSAALIRQEIRDEPPEPQNDDLIEGVR